MSFTPTNADLDALRNMIEGNNLKWTFPDEPQEFLAYAKKMLSASVYAGLFEGGRLMPVWVTSDSTWLKVFAEWRLSRGKRND